MRWAVEQSSVWMCIVLGISIPQTASAQTLSSIVNSVIQVVGGVLIPLAIALLFLVFVISIASYILAANRGEKGLAGLAKKRLLYPVLILLLVFSLWGMLEIIRLFFGG